MGLSVHSQEFLANLRLYLMSSGKNEEEIESIITELNDHLLQAEAEGKDVNDIIGQSPKEYMKQLSKEMPFDRKDILKYSLMVMMGAIAFIMLGDVIRGGIEASLLQLISYPVIILAFLVLIALTFRRIAASSGNKTLMWTLLGLVTIVPTVLILGLLLLDNVVETPTVTFDATWNMIAAVVAVLLIIGLSIWTKTWVMIIIASIVFVPDVILNGTGFQESTKIITSSMLIVLGMGVYLFFMWKKDKRQDVTG